MQKLSGRFHIVLSLLAIFCFSVVVLLSVIFFLSSSVSSKNEDSQNIQLVIKEGDTATDVAYLLGEKHLVKSRTLFLLAMKLGFFDMEKKPFSPKAGTYLIDTHDNMSQIARLLQEGKQNYIAISFQEGLTMKGIANILQENGICTIDDFLEQASSKELLLQYGIEARSFEGYLFPDTYYFSGLTPAKKIIRTMVNNFFEKIKENDIAKDYTKKQLEDLVILSSIVEKEYKVKEEAPLIASVFCNRLKQNIGLYSCATIEYIITDIKDLPHKSKISYEDLNIESQYNTYKWAGLPPGAISNPGLVAMKASYMPANTNYLFFRVKDEKKGTHTFSSNFQEHKQSGMMQ